MNQSTDYFCAFPHPFTLDLRLLRLHATRLHTRFTRSRDVRSIVASDVKTLNRDSGTNNG